jgi:chromate transporter
MVAYIRAMSVDKKRWLDLETFNDGVALCQMIPGATAMQTAAYVGLRTRGMVGAVASYIGFGLPAFLLMMAFAALYASAHTVPVVVSAFDGLQAIVVSLIAHAALSFGRNVLRSWRHAAISIVAAILFGLRMHPILVLLAAAMGGLALLRSRQPALRGDILSMPMQSTKRPLLVILSITALLFFLLFIFERELFRLGVLLFRIDLLAFGGGFSSVPLMFHEVVDVRHWMDGSTLMNGIALGQITPGPIVITATFIGYLLHGPLGGLVATISVFTPSFMLVTGAAPYFDRLRTSPSFNKVISAILCSFVGLLFAVTVRFAWGVHWDVRHVLLASAAFIALLFKIDILWVVAAGVVISVALFT